MPTADRNVIEVRPVGIAHTPFERRDDAPHQGFAAESESTIEVFERFRPALAGLDDVHRVTVLYWAHLADRDELQRADGEGAFTRRGPARPNPISLCTGLLLGVEGRELRVTGLDAVDGSPVIDIKPALQAER